MVVLCIGCVCRVWCVTVRLMPGCQLSATAILQGPGSPSSYCLPAAGGLASMVGVTGGGGGGEATKAAVADVAN